MLASNRLLRWGLLSIVLIASLLTIWVGNRILHAQSTETISTEPLDERIAIKYVSDSGLFEISGWTLSELKQVKAFATGNGQWHDMLSIYIDLPDQGIENLPAVIGEYDVVADSILVFQPTYGWSLGQSYTVVLDIALINDVISSEVNTESNFVEWSFHVPASTVPEEPLTVTNIYPTADDIPENLLRFYIEFSQPMQRGNVYDVVQLLDANGDEVEWSFLRIGQEFWDRDMQVLTIILDPGRIKQGVAPNVDAGAPLTSQHNYELVIGVDITDAYGRQLTDTISKAFVVVAPDYHSPDPTLWTLSSPVADTHDTLMVELDGAIDPILAPRLIRIEDESGQSVPMNFSFGEGEELLYLTPTEAWSSGSYRLAVYPTLEDYAGNRVESLFDMAPGTVADLETTGNEREPIYVDFQVVADR